MYKLRVLDKQADWKNQVYITPIRCTQRLAVAEKKKKKKWSYVSLENLSRGFLHTLSHPIKAYTRRTVVHNPNDNSNVSQSTL